MKRNLLILFLLCFSFKSGIEYHKYSLVKEGIPSNRSLQEMLKDVDSMLIHTIPSALNEKIDYINITDINKIREFIGKIVIDESKLPEVKFVFDKGLNYQVYGNHCDCFGDFEISFNMRGKDETFSFHHMEHIRQSNGNWSMDAPLTQDSAKAIYTWLQNNEFKIIETLLN